MNPASSEAFFEAKYLLSSDPWDFATSQYELSRYDAILRVMASQRYERAFEPGCSVGVFTEKLAGRCEQLYAYDLSPTAVERARERCLALSNVSICQASLESQRPVGGDLYLLSEVGYYLSRGALRQTLEAHIACLAPAAVVIGCHWLGHSVDHTISGDEVHAVIDSVPLLVHEVGERRDRFRLDRWKKQEAR